MNEENDVAAAPEALGLCDDCQMCWAVALVNGRALCLDCGEWDASPADLVDRVPDDLATILRQLNGRDRGEAWRSALRY